MLYSLSNLTLVTLIHKLVNDKMQVMSCHHRDNVFYRAISQCAFYKIKAKTVGQRLSHILDVFLAGNNRRLAGAICS